MLLAQWGGVITTEQPFPSSTTISSLQLHSRQRLDVIAAKNIQPIKRIRHRERVNALRSYFRMNPHDGVYYFFPTYLISGLNSILISNPELNHYQMGIWIFDLSLRWFYMQVGLVGGETGVSWRHALPLALLALTCSTTTHFIHQVRISSRYVFFPLPAFLCLL